MSTDLEVNNVSGFRLKDGEWECLVTFKSKTEEEWVTIESVKSNQNLIRECVDTVTKEVKEKLGNRKRGRPSSKTAEPAAATPAKKGRAGGKPCGNPQCSKLIPIRKAKCDACGFDFHPKKGKPAATKQPAEKAGSDQDQDQDHD
eukprot:c11250_g1_i2.p1 GENE.c11250_g1_i2~~c11250_g1_i2.p1  ORF type:complete len:163 (-),score=42.52 c11250_g1_i2:379-813(-)